MDCIDLATDKNTCCGCGACSNICPKKAITMQEDEKGFIYPKIDESKCIKCGLCLKTCAYKNRETKTKVINAYAAVCTDNDMLLKSASGGVFATIALNIIRQGGVVFGCSMEKDLEGRLEPQHIKITKIEELVKLQGSKYVQSNTKNIYLQVKEELQNNKKVLFSGTPCQVAALKSFIGNNKIDNLYTIDIICHGIPSSRMFKDYVKYVEDKKHIKITNFTFREKSKGKGYFSKIEYIKKGKNKSIIRPAINVSYFQMFLKSINIRENCYACPYANSSRVGDITLGDYWGIDKEHPDDLKKNDIKSSKGVSCIMVNNEKGQNLINDYATSLVKIDSKLEKVQKHNGQLKSPCDYTLKHEQLINLYKVDNYSKIEKWYKKQEGMNYYIKSIWYRIPYWLRKRIKK